MSTNWEKMDSPKAPDKPKEGASFDGLSKEEDDIGGSISERARRPNKDWPPKDSPLTARSALSATSGSEANYSARKSVAFVNDLESANESTPLVPKLPPIGTPSSSSDPRGRSMFAQSPPATIKNTPPHWRPFFLMLAFSTVVCVWEVVNHVVEDNFKVLERRLLCYAVLSVIALLLSRVCHGLAKYLKRKSMHTIEISYLYALFSVLLALSVWGALATAVDILVPKKNELFAWAAVGFVCLCGTLAHGLWTRHNYILEIGGCLALMTSVYDDDDDPILLSRMLSEADTLTPRDRDKLAWTLMQS